MHQEEDTAKNIHAGESGRIAGSLYSLIDFNRSGTPLVEIVTKPEIHSPQVARAFLNKLKNTLLYLDVSDCNMEEGSLRCDANVSMRPVGDTGLGVKTELKNMNSFKHLEKGPDPGDRPADRAAGKRREGGAADGALRCRQRRDQRLALQGVCP